MTDSREIEFLGHPRGLYVLAATEMWERFSFYGMRALLIFYLTKHFLFRDEQATILYGGYVAMLYLLPVVGGALADRYLGARKAVVFGGVLLAFGQSGMAVVGPQAEVIQGEIHRNPMFVQGLFLSLALIAVGVGFLKGNISNIVGKLYAPDDGRRDSGFTIFYMGINIGAAFSALVCGYLGMTWGWSWGFGMAGVGMIIGLVLFLWGQKYLGGHAEPRDLAFLNEKPFAGVSREYWVYLSGLLMVLIVSVLLQNPFVIGRLLGGFSALLAAYLLWYALRHCDREEQFRLLSLIILIVFSVVFWALATQSGSSLGLLIDRVVDKNVWGFSVPASMFQSLPAIMVVALGSMFVALWQWLGRRGLDPSTPLKFTIGTGFCGGSFLVLAYVMAQTPGQELISPWWIVTLYLMQTVGELCLSPVGLSMVTKMSPARISGLMMGVWFLAASTAEFVGGLIARMASVDSLPGEITDVALAKTTYTSVYHEVGMMTMWVTLALLILTPLLKKWMHDPSLRGV